MTFSFVLQRSLKKAVKSLTFRKSNVLLTLSLTLVFFLSSLGNADVGNTDSSSTINQTRDTDGDGLIDVLEDSLGTNKTNKFGDKDKDGLYDFEEVLDHYGTLDDTSGTPKYNYNDSTSYDSDNGPILDIYHYFSLSSNKTNIIRDQIFTEANGGFTDYLLWNVRFEGEYSGGNFRGDVSYSNNVMMNVSFTGFRSGGSFHGDVSYSNNVMSDVSFTGVHSGGSFRGAVNYSNNVMSDISFTGVHSGGSGTDSVIYSNNVVKDISFTGEYSGGSSGVTSYSNGSRSFISYSNNTMTNSALLDVLLVGVL